jgi:hypothetical protein
MPTTVWHWYKKCYICSAVSTFEKAHQYGLRLSSSLLRPAIRYELWAIFVVRFLNCELAWLMHHAHRDL